MAKFYILKIIFVYRYINITVPGLWIRIDLIRIWIQYFCSIRIRIQAKRQLCSQIFLKSKFESNQIKHTCVIHQNLFQKVVGAVLYLFSGKICIFFTEIS
jgi:hypothetical protein